MYLFTWFEFPGLREHWNNEEQGTLLKFSQKHTAHKLTCSSALGKRRFADAWIDCLQITDSICLMNEHETAFPTMMSECEKHSVTVHRFPISGAHLSRLPSDLIELKKAVCKIVSLLTDDCCDQTRNVAVHCAAGMHRTGMVTYCALRVLGYSAVHSCFTLAAMRMLTFVELTKPRRSKQPLIVIAETCFQELFVNKRNV